MALLDGDVKVPGFGEAPKKYVVGGVVIGGGLAVIVYIRSRKAAANTANQTAAQATTSGVTDPAGNTCDAVDPNSGYCPGSPEDVSWQQSNGGYYGTGTLGSDLGYGGGSGVSPAGLVTDPAGNQCTALAASGYCPGTPQDLAAQQASTPAATVPAASGGTPETNSDWMTAALAVLPGGATSANEAALAGVLGGLTVTTAQKNIFLEAVGLEGQPPQGYPTPIKTSDTAQHPGTGSGGKTAGPITGLTVRPSGTGIQAKWNAATNATGGYEWQLSGPQAESGHTTSTTVTIHGLKKGSYNFGIQALPGGQGDNGHATVG